jgi:uncharacterized protein YdaT
MPWTGKEFASKHNKKLSGERANKAARMANAILRETGDDGKAIRIVNSKFSGGGKVMSKDGEKLHGEKDTAKAAKLANHEHSNPRQVKELHMKKGGKCYAAGGSVSKEDPEIEAGEVHKAHGEHAVQKRGNTKAKHFAGGGMVGKAHARADGIAARGYTKGKCC